MSTKTVERVQKLLRLAAPASGGSEHERTSAALEAARLIAEHELTISEKSEVRKPRRESEPRREGAVRRPATPTSSTYSYAASTSRSHARAHGWKQTVAPQDGVCADQHCDHPIHKGDPVWMKMNGFIPVYVHLDGPCGW